MKRKISKSCIMKLIGAVLFVVVLLFSLPIAIPRLMGYHVYSVTSDSMNPTLNEGNIIYVNPIPAEEILEDDIISFYIGSDENNIITHRVISINEEEGYFETKGDNNNTKDEDPVYFDNYLGRLTYDLPGGLFILNLVDSIIGKIILILFLIVALILWILADRSKGKQPVIEYKRKNGKWNLIYGILITAGLVMIVYSLLNIIDIYKDYSSSNELYSELSDQYIKIKDNDKSDKTAWYDILSVDFEGLKAKNSDVCAWIYFENEDISYPVMYSGDDDYYLRRTLDKSDATAGSIFLEGENNSDFSDLHSIIYGHNMKNLSMFGKLKYYDRDEEYYDSHQYFQIILPDKKLRYQIYSYETVSEDSSIYTVGYGQDDNFQQFINQTISDSLRDTGIVPQTSDRIVTLSTCSTSGDTYRFVVHGVLVSEYEEFDE